MSEESDRKRRHTLADHRFGIDADHVHDHDGEHDHDHDAPEDGVDRDALAHRDEIRLTSVGIDIGSSGTQVVFARLRLQRRALDLTGRYAAVERTVLFAAPVAFTPYASGDRIDHAALKAIVDHAYADAGLHPDAIDAGAIILTGAALQRENARAIADELADIGGEFVCAAAGHHMEAMLAAYGSGAALASHERNLRVLNIDIGGGTTKLALIDDGRVVATGALAIGGRGLAVDEGDRITHLDATARRFAAALGFAWREGERVDREALARLADAMAERLIETLVAEPMAAGADLYLTERPAGIERADCVRFSGGVAEYVYGREERDFGDLGRLLGSALRRRIDAGRLPWRLMPAGECIRATALGASSYGMQLSGRTIYVSDPGALLPRRNLQVLQPACALRAESIEAGAVSAAIRRHMTMFDVAAGDTEFALAFRWHGEPSFARIAALARGILDALVEAIVRGRPLYIVVDGDIAQTLGALLKEELGVAGEVLVLDGLTLWDFDYIDLGRVRMPSHSVPVTIKSLVFKDDPRLPHAHHGHALFAGMGTKRR